MTVVEAAGGAATTGAGCITTVAGWAAGGLVTVVQAVTRRAAPATLRTRAREVIRVICVVPLKMLSLSPRVREAFDSLDAAGNATALGPVFAGLRRGICGMGLGFDAFAGPIPIVLRPALCLALQLPHQKGAVANSLLRLRLRLRLQLYALLRHVALHKLSHKSKCALSCGPYKYGGEGNYIFRQMRSARRAPAGLSKPIERVEVISGRERRRRCSAEEKVRLVEQASRPGMTVPANARLQGVSPSHLPSRP